MKTLRTWCYWPLLVATEIPLSQLDIPQVENEESTFRVGFGVDTVERITLNPDARDRLQAGPPSSANVNGSMIKAGINLTSRISFDLQSRGGLASAATPRLNILKVKFQFLGEPADKAQASQWSAALITSGGYGKAEANSAHVSLETYLFGLNGVVGYNLNSDTLIYGGLNASHFSTFGAMWNDTATYNLEGRGSIVGVQTGLNVALTKARKSFFTVETGLSHVSYSGISSRVAGHLGGSFTFGF